MQFDMQAGNLKETVAIGDAELERNLPSIPYKGLFVVFANAPLEPKNWTICATICKLKREAPEKPFIRILVKKMMHPIGSIGPLTRNPPPPIV